MSAISRVVSGFTMGCRAIRQDNSLSKISLVARNGMVIMNSSGRSMATISKESCKKNNHKISDALNEVVLKSFAVHPFSDHITKGNIRSLLCCYFAMSQAFPYIQAGAYRNLILDCISKNISVPKSMEESFVVGAFLSFDETGGNYLLRTKGIQALPEILDTDIHFHASLLKKDIQSIFGKELQPDYSAATQEYLHALLEDLGSKDPVRRSAAMVAFEMHAGQMIEALWTSLSKLYPEKDKDSLEYFKVHVGGDDPQEEYHKMLTQKMVESVVFSDDKSVFVKEFTECYAKNYKWCLAICNKK